MDNLTRKTIKAQLIKAFLLCLVGVVLFFAELSLSGRSVAVQQVPFIILLASLFFAIGLLANAVYLPLVRKGGKQLMGYYLLYKVVRFLIAVVVLVIYAVADMNNLLVFAINLLVMYLIEMICSIAFCAEIERNTLNN